MSVVLVVIVMVVGMCVWLNDFLKKYVLMRVVKIILVLWRVEMVVMGVRFIV